ncbi:MAG: hypothetical protein WBE38_01080 [Terracidiphilus sp.]|jgi:hypothetical protein
MTILLNIALLIIGAASTMSAFGGKTWREGPEPILERITSRGWISLFCLILAVCLGVTKEIRSQIADTLAKSNSEKEQAAAKAQARESELQLKLANAGVENLKLSAKGAQDKLELTESKLEATEDTLNEVRSNLTSTRDDLQEENNLGLLSVLATAKLGVSDITFVIPFTSKGNSSLVFYRALMPGNFPDVCQEQTKVNVILSTTNSDEFEFLQYEPDDIDGQHNYTHLDTSEISKGTEVNEPTADILLSGADYEDQVKYVVRAIGQTSSNSAAYVADIHFGQDGPSASGLIKSLQGQDGRPITIVSRNDQASNKQCSQLVNKYFAAAFDKAYMRLTLNNAEHLTMFYSLKALPQFNDKGNWGLPFAIDSKPGVSANDDLGQVLDIDWPNDHQGKMEP